MSPDHVLARRGVSHRTIQLCLLLLPVWIFGAGELARFVSLNATPGDLERNGMVKGRDFVAFYVAGALARAGRWQALYDVGELRQEVARIVPAAAGQIPAPAYGPQVALFFSPLARLPYLEARWVWFGLTVLAYLLAAGLVMQKVAPLRAHRGITWVTIVCNPAFGMVLATGQTGALAALAWALAAVALTRKRPLWFGLCLGLLAYKPTLLIGVVPALMLRRDWTVLAGVALSAAGQWSVGLLLTDIGLWRDHVASLASLAQSSLLLDVLPHQKQSLSGFFQLLVGPGAAAVALTVLTGTGIVAFWWAQGRQLLRAEILPMLAVTTVLLSPHFYVYDLVVLTPALLIVAARLSRHDDAPGAGTIAWWGYALLFAPFSGALAQRTGLQLSTLVLTAFFVALHRAVSPQASSASRDGPRGRA